MFEILTNGVLETHTNFTVTAAAVCTLMATTLVLLMRNAELSSEPRRLFGLIWIALVAGVGVWATHFVAMVGYRPDLTLTYGPVTTAISSALGIIFVGGPIAASTLTDSRTRLIALGITAGMGVGAMHLTGMAAIENCLTTYNPVILGTGLVVGCISFAAALTRKGPGVGVQVRRGLGIVVGVCALHFIAMSGVSLEILQASAQGIGDFHLSLAVAVVSIIVFAVALKATLTRRRLNALQQAAEQKTARQLAAFSTALQNMSNGLVMVDNTSTITAINDRVFDLFGLERGSVESGTKLRTLMTHISQVQAWSEELMSSKFSLYLEGLSEGRTVSHEEELIDGRTLFVSCRMAPDAGVVITFDDVSALCAARAEINHLAHSDPLTGLLNRRSFREYVHECQMAGDTVVALLLDLDHFKSVNDTLGHPAGDTLLKETAARIREIVGDQGTIFRLGGDEMVVLLRGIHMENPRDVAEGIVERIGVPFELEGRILTIGCSIGMYVSSKGDSASLILQKADLALYRAKNLGRGRFECYEEGMQEEAKLRHQVKVDIAAAIEHHQFLLNYQPLFRLPERSVVGFEALIRWDHPELGHIAPMDFIPLAEETGQIVDIGNWVLDEACRQLAKWPKHLHIAVNVSPVQMRDATIVDTVRKALDRHQISPERLTLELTETAIVMDGKILAENISTLRAYGIKISMDDFGTGYSSLTHLREFELDEIKIDRSFVASEKNDQGAQAVTKAVTGMAKSLSIGTVGEGVETEEHLERLNALGCEVAQGYLLSRPLDATAASELLGQIEDNVDRIFDRVRKAS